MSLVMRGWIEVIGCLIMLIQLSNVGGQSTTASCNGKTSGRTFYVAFMEVANMQQLNLQVFASRGSSAPDPIEVTIEISGFGSSTLTIASDDPLSFNIPSDKVLRGSSTSQNGVFINATADVSVLALVEEAQACSSITIHSATALGRRYVATTYAPNLGAPAGNFLAEIAVVATSANTEVQFKFPEGMLGNVMFDGTTYTGGQTLNVRLNRLGTAQVQSESDLTGTLITSSADTAVFSGNMKASLSEAVGAVMEQLVHISTAPAASVYVFQNFPGPLAYMIKLVATQPNTEVSILAQAGIDQTTLASVGSSYSKQFGSNEIAIVESNRPLQAMQIGVTRPALMTVPSTISYLPEFRFAIPFDTNIVDYENTILIVANATDTNTFQLNGAAIPSSSLTWRSSGVAGRTFQVGTLTASAGYQVITNTNTGARFTVAVYGSSDDHNCAYAYSAGMCLDWIVPGEQSLSSSTSAQQIQTGRTTPPRGQSSTTSQSTSSGSTSLSQSTSSGSTTLSLSSSTVINNIPGSSETSRERNPTPTVSGSSTESTTELSSSLPSGSSESTVRRGRTPTASSSTETPTISISSTPTFPVSSSTTAPISSTPTFSPSLSPSATFTVSSSGPVSTFGPSDGLSTTTVSSGTSELFSASGSTSLSSSTSTSGTSPARSPTQFSTVSTLSTQPSGISSPTRMPTDFTTLSSGESTILPSGESTRMPTDFSTLSNSEPNPSSSTREPTNFSTVSNGTVMSTSEGSAVSTTPTIQFTGTSAPVGSEEYTVPISSANEEGQSVLIHITNPSDAPITVTLTFQGKDKEITVPPGDVHSEFIARPANFPSGLPTETARLKSDSPFVASVTMVGSCSSYLAIPNEGLGKRYQVITWDPASSPMGNAWFTISTVKSTIVKIAIPEGTCVVKSSYINPLCGDEFQVYLPDYAAITFTSIDDLSGTTIESQEPVLVIAGNDDINIGSTSVSDNSISELFPVEAWGTDFVVPPVPENDGSGYSIKMSCGSSPATATVQSASGKTTHELTKGKSVVVEFTDNSIISISSDSPIQVLQFVRGGQPPSGTGCPSSLNVVSTSLYLSTYYTDVWLSKAAYIDYVTMIIEGSEAENLMMDDEAVDSEDWKDVPGTTMKCKHMKITNQRTKFSHTSEKFGLFRYSYLKATDIDKACALSYVAGADFSYAKSMNESTTPAASNESSTLMPSTTMASAGSTMTMGSTTTAAPSMLQITDCSCLNLTSTIQPGTSGAYYLEGQQYKNKPVYKRKDCELYLYYYEDSSVGYWLVGPEIGDSRAYIANTRIYRPINDTQPGSWTVYDEEADDFVADPGLQIKCSCSLTTSCTSGEFTQNGTSLLEGVFSLADQFYNGNPVYEHESGKLFLYYNRDSTGTCSYWVVSNKLGSTAGIIYAYDTSAQSPGDVITWQIKGQATSSDKISFTCYSSSEEDS